uniref:Ig-like domain-containing protein n=1 Tax=Heterorhabditis bacteriophora TaxID=37862 RepID=A0A1I7W6E2_HETBA
MSESSILMFPTLLCQMFNVCSRHSSPILRTDSMGSTIALLGQDVDFSCKVDNLGRHMVAFVRAGSPPRLISFDEKVITVLLSNDSKLLQSSILHTKNTSKNTEKIIFISKLNITNQTIIKFLGEYLTLGKPSSDRRDKRPRR